jgi:hypothetical protein
MASACAPRTIRGVFMVGIVSYNWAYLLGFVVLSVGLLFLGFGLLAARGSDDRSDRLFMGAALVATAIVTVVLFGEVYGGALFSDSASSVSNAPNP